MSTYEKDLRIIEAATDGPWFVAEKPREDGLLEVEDGRHFGLFPITAEAKEANYIAHFNPVKVRELVTSLRSYEEENQRLKTLCVDLLNAADKCAEPPNYIVQPFLRIFKDHADKIKELLK